MDRPEIVSLPLDLLNVDGASETICRWAASQESRVVLATNVHMVMEARDDPGLRALLSRADLSVPDGRPVVWALRLLGMDASHVRGSDLMRRVCEMAEARGFPIGLHGSTDETLSGLQSFLHRTYPGLKITYAASPPFGPVPPDEDQAEIRQIASSGARVLLVGLGCPKQERWMMDHRGSIPCVMIGVGAAFDFLGGTAQEAPLWMQRSGLEWLFRLASDPRRLWRRYLKHNPRFVALFALQWLRHLTSRGKG